MKKKFDSVQVRFITLALADACGTVACVLNPDSKEDSLALSRSGVFPDPPPGYATGDAAIARQFVLNTLKACVALLEEG